MKIGFIGLGNVGGKLASSLLRNNFDLTIRDLDERLTKPLKDLGAKVDHWIIAIYIGFIMQPITYGCFYYVLKNNPLYKVLPIVTMGIPPTGLMAAIFLLGEKPTPELFIGGAIIIVGVILIVFTKNKKEEVTKWK